ncbi:MAG: hypothetical protein Faunusvirus66_2 [Faunusvirus sp.]|jgi:hypothetical protein|uniref:Uncharacterized protein n=1 Tax=Faunusvirus sp. TaxID=2487766 RepID=A0A3G4ZY60_9VIRU|nr:MAG: hypothetical protein Faunusvirus66_2 [Faunusvirus sp.]
MGDTAGTCMFCSKYFKNIKKHLPFCMTCKNAIEKFEKYEERIIKSEKSEKKLTFDNEQLCKENDELKQKLSELTSKHEKFIMTIKSGYLNEIHNTRRLHEKEMSEINKKNRADISILQKMIAKTKPKREVEDEFGLHNMKLNGNNDDGCNNGNNMVNSNNMVNNLNIDSLLYKKGIVAKPIYIK